jgi:hypothetical protein
MTEKTVEWLVQEVNDLLDVSSVGLYELMNLLNDPEDPMPPEERAMLARQALEQILAHEGVGLYWMQWPEYTHHGTLSIEDLPEDPFGTPNEHGRYVAIDRS